MLNVYHVRNLGAGGPAANVAQTLIEWIYPVLRLIQASSLSRTFIEVENLGSAFDFATVDTSAFPGLDINQKLSTLTAATIQFNRTRNDIKNGQKRFAVGAEDNVNGNAWDSAFLTQLQDLGDKLVDQWELDATPGVKRLELVILKRFCKTVPSPPCLSSYELPSTDALIDANFYRPLTATPRATVRSQVSRKQLV